MIRTILAATDGSDPANRAIELASSLAEFYKSKLVLLHVLPDVVNDHIPPHIEKFGEFERLEVGEALNQLGQNIMDQARQRVRDHGAKDVETVIATGSPAKEILKVAEHYNADTIVLGNRGLGGLDGLLMGSVSHKVSQLAKQTCITVR